MSKLGIECISVFGMPPVAFIELAAKLGCPNISLGLTPMDYNPYGYPRYSVAEDADLRRDIRAALEANEVEISLGENLAVLAEADNSDAWKLSLDIMSEFGVKRFNSVSFETDFGRNVDQYAKLTELAASYGAKALIEFVPIFGIADLATAVDVVRQVGRPELGLIMDTMHLGRTGVTADMLRELPAEMIGYIQICDAPLRSNNDYMDEAVHERRCPGDGELPVLEYLAALPRDRVVSIEVPQRRLVEAGVEFTYQLADCVRKTKEMIASIN